MAHVPVRHPSGALRASQSALLPIGQRFGSALNLNIHFHVLFLDGVYVTTGERLTFRRVPPPTVAALEKLVHLISKRVGRALERQGLLVWDVENSFLSLDSADASGFEDLLGHSITYRIALGPHQGRKAFTLQTVPAVAAADDNSSLASNAATDAAAPGRSPWTVTDAVLERMRELLGNSPESYGYLRATWSSELLAIELERQLNIAIYPSTVRRASPGLGYVWRRARPILIRRDPGKNRKMRAIRRALRSQPGRETF